MFFRDVVGQKEVKERLIRSVKEERVSHALMLSGQEGSGAFNLAFAFAQYVSCRNRGEDDSCGTCPSCHKYLKMIHPDLHFVFPVVPVKKGSRDSATQTGSNEEGAKKIKEPTSDDFIREWREFVLNRSYFTLNGWLSYLESEKSQGLIYTRESDLILRKLSLKSFEAEYKVMIIWLPERMHISCANKLLKLLEEPPAKTLFLLVTENEEQIIGTIRSRSQLIRVPAIDDESLRQALEAMDGVTSEMAEEAANLASGNYIKALECLYPDEDSAMFFARLQEMMRFAWGVRSDGGKVLELVRWAEDMAGLGRERQKNFFEFSLRLIREYFVMNLKNEALVRLNSKEREWGMKFSPYINERNIIPVSREFEASYKHISMNGNPKIIFLDTALRMVKLVRP